MYFPKEYIQALRNRVRLSSVISRYISVKPANAGGEYKALCPFHGEKTPSFTISDKKGFYHCFGCGAHGDAIGFVKDYNNLPYPEAVKELALSEGIELPKVSHEQRQKYDEIEEVKKANENATSYFESSLKKNNEVIDYLKGRNITGEMAKKFRLGYAEQGKGLEEFLTKFYKANFLQKAGLILSNEKGSYPRFRDRLMFPIFDESGGVIAFGGRIIGEGEPKYLNSPETPSFNKSFTLYGLNFARNSAYKTGEIILVEGYMDVIAMHRGGMENAVATLGTSTTEHHLQKLWRYSNTPTVCLDGDNAGKRAMVRVSELALPFLSAEKSLKFVILPEGKDPDDIVNKSGREGLLQAFSRGISISDILWQGVLSKNDISTPEGKAKLEKSCLDIANKIEDEATQRSYREFFKSKIWELVRGKKSVKGIDNQELLNNLKNTLKESEKELLQVLAVIFYNKELLEDDDVYFSFSNLNISNEIIANFHDEILGSFDEESEVHKYIIEQISALILINKDIKDLSLDRAKLFWEICLKKYELVLIQEDIRNGQFSLDVIREMNNQVVTQQNELLELEQEYMDTI